MLSFSSSSHICTRLLEKSVVKEESEKVTHITDKETETQIDDTLDSHVETLSIMLHPINSVPEIV